MSARKRQVAGWKGEREEGWFGPLATFMNDKSDICWERFKIHQNSDICTIRVCRFLCVDAYFRWCMFVFTALCTWLMSCSYFHIFRSFIMSIDLLAHGVTPCLGTFAGQFSAILVKQNGWFNGEPRFIHHYHPLNSFSKAHFDFLYISREEE